MNDKIKCPSCGHAFAVEAAFKHQLEEQLRAENEEKIRRRLEDLNKDKEEVDKQKKTLGRMVEEQQELLRKKFDLLKDDFLKEAEQKAIQKKENEMLQLKKEVEDRKKENAELKQKELQLMQMESKLRSQHEEFELLLQKKLLEQQETIADEVKRRESEKTELLILDFKKKIADQEKQVDEMKRKLETGSQQFQGEVLELVLEDQLKSLFPVDVISEVGKGIKGADLSQTVVNSLLQQCGTILIESKRTKAFSDQWIEKLKGDMREAGAALGIIITETMPREMEKFGLRNGVWVCGYHEFKGLIFVLREMLIREYQVRQSTENKGDKMEMLYNYLTGNEFKMRVESIVEGFTTLKDEMEREKRAMQKIWKEREKQIDKVVTNTIDMYGSIRGIGGAAIGVVKQLELDRGEDDDL